MIYVELLKKAMEKKGQFFETGVGNLENGMSAEKLLGCKLPQDYKEFLNAYGYVEWFGNTIYGITPPDYEPDEGYDASVVHITSRFKTLFPKLSFDAVIAIDHRGGFYFYKDGEPTVFHYEHEINEVEPYSANIHQFVIPLIPNA